MGDGAAAAHPAFRLAEKHFKNRSSARLPALRGLPPTLCKPVLDLSRPHNCDEDEVWRAGWWAREHAEPSNPSRRQRPPKVGRERPRGVRPELACAPKLELEDGRAAYVVAEGCILIPGYLSPDEQEELLLAALGEYTRPPNPLSLDTHYDVPANLFELFATKPEHEVLPKHVKLEEDERLTHAEAAKEVVGTRKLIETAPASTMGFDEVKRRNETWTGDVISLKVPPKTVETLIREMRWANLGWVYQWSTKSYDFSTDDPIPFPPKLASLCQKAVSQVPWGEAYTGVAADNIPRWAVWKNDYEPDTGIVNFYQLGDTLMAHVDRSELDNSRPLVSISLGHAAIFLLGTDSREDPPQPVILRSGDVFIMSGRGRQAYHGVPRIMEDTLPAHFREREGDSELLRAAKRFVSTARININARQVFPPGFQRPSACASTL